MNGKIYLLLTCLEKLTLREKVIFGQPLFPKQLTFCLAGFLLADKIVMLFLLCKHMYSTCVVGPGLATVSNNTVCCGQIYCA